MRPGPPSRAFPSPEAARRTPGDRVPARCTPNAHVERRAYGRSPSPERPLPTKHAAVPSPWSHSHQGRDLLVTQASKLRELRDQGSRQVRSHPRHRLQQIPLRRPDRTGSDPRVQFVVHLDKLALEPLQVLPNSFLNRLHRLPQAILLLRDHRHELPPPADERIQDPRFL